jgi:hypothetical protein
MPTLHRAPYRVRQFVHGLRPHLSPAEAAEARSRLSETEFSLFLGAEPRDRRHSMDLFHLLRAEGASDDALVAALVHDVGKGRLAAWHRVAFVLLDAATPGLARRVEAERGAGWRRALWRLRNHAALGAELLAQAGSSARTVELVRAHTSPAAEARDGEIARFVRADDRV